MLQYEDEEMGGLGGYDLVHYDDLAYVASAHQERKNSWQDPRSNLAKGSWRPRMAIWAFTSLMYRAWGLYHKALRVRIRQIRNYRQKYLEV